MAGPGTRRVSPEARKVPALPLPHLYSTLVKIGTPSRYLQQRHRGQWGQ